MQQGTEIFSKLFFEGIDGEPFKRIKCHLGIGRNNKHNFFSLFRKLHTHRILTPYPICILPKNIEISKKMHDEEKNLRNTIAKR